MNTNPSTSVADKFTLEVCCGSAEDVFAAFEGGANRVELNSALSLGGLTPSPNTIYIIRQKLPNFPIAAMVRPRGGGFTYTDTEFEQMKLDAHSLMDAGADAIVFGFLTPDLQIDRERTADFIQMIHAAGREAVFHRAFDLVTDMDVAISLLIDLGADRVLTSGGTPSVMQGIQTLHQLQDQYGNRIQILAGSGVRPENSLEILSQTGISQLHSSCKKNIPDLSAKGRGMNPVDFSLYEQPAEMLDCVDAEVVRRFRLLSTV